MRIPAGGTPQTPSFTQRGLYADASIFVASAATIWSGLQESSTLLAVLGGVFLIWSSLVALRSRRAAAKSNAHTFVDTHSRWLNLAAFVGAAVLTWHAISASLPLPSVMGSLLLVATAYKLLEKKTA